MAFSAVPLQATENLFICHKEGPLVFTQSFNCSWPLFSSLLFFLFSKMSLCLTRDAPSPHFSQTSDVSYLVHIIYKKYHSISLLVPVLIIALLPVLGPSVLHQPPVIGSSFPPESWVIQLQNPSSGCRYFWCQLGCILQTQSTVDL